MHGETYMPNMNKIIFVIIILISPSYLTLFVTGLNYTMNSYLKNTDASFIGQSSREYSGCSISGAGDVNGDGYDDLIIGAYNNTEGGKGAGKAYLLFGKATGWTKNFNLTNADASFIGERLNSQSGLYVAGGGDVNGDGFDDILIGAPYRTFLIFGKATGWTKNFNLTNADASFTGGGLLTDTGDFNGDGLDDIFISVNLFFGRETGWKKNMSMSEANVTFSGGGGGVSSIANVKDVNGDGLDDIVLGFPTASYNNGEGMAYLLFGKNSNWPKTIDLSNADASFVGAPEPYGDRGAGWSVASIGDVNHDGYHDFLIAAPHAGQQLWPYQFGRTYLVMGNSTGWKKYISLINNSISFIAEGMYDQAGTSVAGGGDINGDGYSDFLIGAPRNYATITTPFSGRSYLILGGQSTWHANTSLSNSNASFIGEASYDYSGTSIANAGDVNGDGHDDVFISAYMNDIGGIDSGKSYLIFPDINNVPSKVEWMKTYSDITFSNEISSTYINDTIYTELVGIDGNMSRADVIPIKITNDNCPICGYKSLLYETGNHTGKYRGAFRITNLSNIKKNWIKASVGDTIKIAYIRDQSVNNTIYITGDPQIRPRIKNYTFYEDKDLQLILRTIGNPITTWTIDTDIGNLTWSTGERWINISGKPNNGDVGSHWFDIKAKDIFGKSDDLNLTISIINEQLNITTNNTKTIFQDQPYYINYNSTDDGQGTVAWHLKTNATWLNMNKNSGVLNGTPSNSNVGKYWINVTVDDGNGGWDWTNFSLTVININDPPIILTEDVTTATQDIIYQVNYKAVDIDIGDQVIAWYFKSNASWLSLGNNTQVLYGKPTNDDIGKYWVNISAEDMNNGLSFHNFTLTVINVNDPPEILSSPNTTATVLYLYEYHILARDIDKGDILNFSLQVSPKNMTIDENTGIITWMPTSDQSGKNLVIVNISDGKVIIHQTFNITMTIPQPTLLLPVNNTIVATLKPELSWLFLYERNDNITYDFYLDTNEKPTTLYASGIKNTNFTVNDQLIDSKTYYWKIRPRIGNIVGDYSQTWRFQIFLGTTVRLELDQNSIKTYRGQSLTVNMTITNDGIIDGFVIISLNTTLVPNLFSYTANISIPSKASKTIPLNIAIPKNMKYGNYEVTISAKLSNSRAKKVLTLSVIRKPTPATNFWQNPWFWGIIILLTILAVLGIAYQTITKKRTEKELEAAKLQAETVENFEIDEIFLIYKDGRMITHVARRDSKIDDQIFSGMLIAIQSFVKDSFQSEEGLTSFEFGSRKIILEKGEHLFLVVALTGSEPTILRPQMNELAIKIENLYTGVIEDWDGSNTSFKDVEQTLVSLYGIKDGLKIKKEKEEVKIRSGVEFFSGFVRLKVAIKNELSTPIDNVELEIGFDDRILRLDHIEPEYQFVDKKILFGKIDRDEKRTVAFYLDPLICQDSHISGIVNYMDPYGNKGKVEMKPRPVDIVCPIFYTKETINLAMLKKLLGELQYKDSRIYKVKYISTLERIYNLGNVITKAHDVKFVREYKQKTPFEAESWYYGEVKETSEKIVIRIAARESKEYLELFIATGNLSTLTGLLAELAGQLNARIKRVDELKDAIIPTTDEWLKEEIDQTDLLLNKMVSVKKIHKYVVVQKENPKE